MNAQQNIVKLAMVTDELLKRAQAAQQTKQAGDNQASQLIPALVDSLVKHERITPEMSEKVAKTLQTHTGALDVLSKVAEHRNAHELLAIGRPHKDTEKKAGEHLSSASPDHDETPAGRAFRDRIMNGVHARA